MDCDQCGREIDNLPYTCTGCEEQFCVEHRLPEAHDCVALKAEQAGQENKREQREDGPWFKDGFRLSSVDDQGAGQSSDKTADDSTNTKDRYRSANANEECSECGTPLFEHEAAGCPHCGEIYCGEHLTAHRKTCDERDSEGVESSATVAEHYHERTHEKQQDRKTRTDELEKERQERFSSPDVNPDGSLSEAEYEDDIQSISSDEEQKNDSTGSDAVLWITLIVSVSALVLFLVYLIVL